MSSSSKLRMVLDMDMVADDLAYVCQRYLDGVTRLRYCTFSAVWAKITN